jgi:hypothetical protein
MTKEKIKYLVPPERIASRIYLIRGQKVILDFDLAAVQVNVAIVRTFVKLREMLATNEELARKVAQQDRQIAVLFDQVQKMLAPVPAKKNPIGYIHPK